MSVYAEAESQPSLALDAKRRGEGEQQEDLERIQAGKLVWPTEEEFALGFSGSLHHEELGDVELTGVALRAGIPHNILANWNLRKLAAYAWVESRVQRPFWRGVLGPGLRDFGEGTEPASADKEKLAAWAETAAADIAKWDRGRRTRPMGFMAFLAKEGSVVPPAERALVRSNAAYLIEEIVGRSDALDPVYAPPELNLVSSLRQSAAEIHNLLRRRVVYLGPLREDPRVTYRSTPAGATGYIGTKGEYMASVLHSNRARDVACPLSDGELKNMRLTEALDYWVSELGLADSVITTDRGRLGIQVSVSRGGIKGLDLMSVGVGVSQLLPVVLMCLLAPPWSLVLLEQPELHLHPALQQKLGDFLMACSKGGRQLLVETHSEYLIQRLRRRIAEDSTDELVRQVAVYFAEQTDGVSEFRQVELNALGGIEDWPEGFFDQSSDESRRILEAGIGKKLDPARATDGGAE